MFIMLGERGRPGATITRLSSVRIVPSRLFGQQRCCEESLVLGEQCWEQEAAEREREKLFDKRRLRGDTTSYAAPSTKKLNIDPLHLTHQRHNTREDRRDFSAFWSNSMT